MDSLGFLRAFWRVLRSKLFSSNTKAFFVCLFDFAFFTVLTFALMIQKQWSVKLLVPLHESEQWHETILMFIVFFTAVQFKLAV